MSIFPNRNLIRINKNLIIIIIQRLLILQNFTQFPLQQKRSFIKTIGLHTDDETQCTEIGSIKPKWDWFY